jgi:hypothetical protein
MVRQPAAAAAAAVAVAVVVVVWKGGLVLRAVAGWLGFFKYWHQATAGTLQLRPATIRYCSVPADVKRINILPFLFSPTLSCCQIEK